MHPLVAEAARAHEDLENTHRKWYEFMRTIARAIRDGETGLSQEDRADLVYFVKHMFDIFDDLRKETRVSREMLDAIICTVWITQQSGERSVKGDLASAMPRLTTQPRIPSPKKEPTKYGQLLKNLGVTNEDVIARGVLRLHWPSMVNWCTECSEQGLPLPAGVDPSDNESGYATTIRKRPDVDLDEYRKEAHDVVAFDDQNSTEREDF